MNKIIASFVVVAGLSSPVLAQTLSDGKTYLISNLVETNHFMNDTGNLTYGMPGANALWRFVPTGKDGCYFIQNDLTGRYIQTSTTKDVGIKMGDTPVEYHIIKDTSSGNTKGCWGFASTDQNNYDFTSSATMGLNDNVNGYVAGYEAQQGINRRSFWMIEEVGETLLPEDLSDPTKVYSNPVLLSGVPDPTVIRGEDGYYYLYATENPVHNVPIYRSPDLVDWTLIGTVFTDETRPDFVPSTQDPARVWAPDINYSDGKYYLYYSMSRWGSEWECGIGVATADKPEGPFTNHGKMFISSDHGLQNSIDPFFIEEDGRKYLFWGSFRGIWGAELTDDGLQIKPETITTIAGTLTEGTYIIKNDGYYYLIGSAGSCCDGPNSTYHLVMARSENLFGPYVNKNGDYAKDNNFSHLLYRNEEVIGPGHNAEFVQDDAGQWWVMYHGFMESGEVEGRVGYLDRVYWTESGWPAIRGMQPSTKALKPIINENVNTKVSVNAMEQKNDSLFNLQGQRVDDGYRGIVISNGQKTLRQ